MKSKLMPVKPSQTANSVTKRKYTGDVLHPDQADFRDFCENAHDLMQSVDANKRFVFVNNEWLKTLGYSPEEVERLKLTDILRNDQIPHCMELFKKVCNGESLEKVETVFISKDEREIYVEGNVRPRFKDGNFISTIGIFRNVTERRKVEEATFLAYTELDQIFNTAACGMRVINEDFNMLRINDTFSTLFCVDKDQALGKKCYEVLPGPYCHTANCPLSRILGGDERVAYDVEKKRKDGKSIFCIMTATALRKSNGELAGIVQSYADVTERRQAEEALRESEERYRLHFDNVNDVIYSIDAELKVISVSPSVEKILGYRPEELIGRQFTELNVLAPESWEQAISDTTRVLGGETISSSEYTFIAKDGSERFGEVSGAPLFRDGGDVAAVISVGRDITERKRAEMLLSEREERFRALIENAQDAVTIINSDGIVQYESPSIKRVLGYTPDELIGQDVLSLVHPDDLPMVNEKLASMLENPNSVGTAQVRYQHKDGSWRVIEAIAQNLLDNPAVNGIVVNYRDITDRKMAEESLQRSEEYFRTITENSLDAIVVLNSNGDIRFKTPTFERMFGESRRGSSPFETIHPDDLPQAMKAFRELIGNPGSTIHTEVRGQHRDGSWRTFEVYGRNLVENPVIGGIVTNFRDITGRKTLEQQLQLAGRLAAVGELAAGVAHELNNPLASVQAYAQLLNERDDLDEMSKSDIATIYREAQRAARITGNLLSFARKHKPEKHLISLNEVIEKSVELHAYRMKVNNIEVMADLYPELPMVMADFDQMQQIFVNIITNAEQAMTEAHKGGILNIRSEKANGVIRVSFSDDGPGIPEENLNRIFDPFFTTKDVGKGTGLGLSICYGIMQEHGGSIYAESKSDMGATFIIDLPIIPHDAG